MTNLRISPVRYPALHSPHPSEKKRKERKKNNNNKKGSGEKKEVGSNPYAGASKTPVGKSYCRQSRIRKLHT
jgi:hypothetical protein